MPFDSSLHFVFVEHPISAFRAAHAMPPFLGQGANQAIQDSYALARALSRVGTDYADMRSALSAYEKCRIPPTRSLMLKSRLIGTLETQDGIGAFVRNNLFRILSASGVMEAQYLNSALPIVLEE
jgi:salicylate hydroxylase